MLLILPSLAHYTKKIDSEIHQQFLWTKEQLLTILLKIEAHLLEKEKK